MRAMNDILAERVGTKNVIVIGTSEKRDGMVR